MIHPHTVLSFVNHDVGYGVFATRVIPRDAITWVRDERMSLSLSKTICKETRAA